MILVICDSRPGNTMLVLHCLCLWFDNERIKNALKCKKKYLSLDSMKLFECGLKGSIVYWEFYFIFSEYGFY